MDNVNQGQLPTHVNVNGQIEEPVKQGYSKLTYAAFGLGAAATGAALYVLNQSDDDTSIVPGTTSGLAQAAQTAITNTGVAVAALIADNIFRQQHNVETDNDIDDDYLSDFEIDDDDVGSDVDSFVSAEDLEDRDDLNDFEDATDMQIERRKTSSNRPLMYPKGVESTVDSTAVQSYHSITLTNGNKASVLEQSGRIYVVIKDEDGGVVVSKFQISNSADSCHNPKLSCIGSNIGITWSKVDNFDDFTQAMILNNSGGTVKARFDASSDSTVFQAHKPVIKETGNGESFIANVARSSIKTVRLDTSYNVASGPNSFSITDDTSAARTADLAVYADRSAINMYEDTSTPATTDLKGWYMDTNGAASGSEFSLGQCHTPSTVHLPGPDLAYASCVSPSGLQAFGLNKAQGKTIPQFTVAASGTSGDVGINSGGTRVAHHIIDGGDSSVRIFDVAQLQIDSSTAHLGANIPVASSTSMPNINYYPNGNIGVSYVRGGLLRDFTLVEAIPPTALGAIPVKNATIGQSFNDVVLRSNWDSHGLDFNITGAQVLGGADLSTIWPDFSLDVSDNAVFSGVPPVRSQGLYKIEVLVDNGFYNGVTQTPYDIRVINTDPILGALPSPVLNVGQVFSEQLTATNTDGDILTYSSPDVLSGASVSTSGLFGHTPVSGQQGSHNYRINLSDGEGGGDTGTIPIFVLNRDPVAPTQSGVEQRQINTFFSYTFPPCTDGDLDPLTHDINQVGVGGIPGSTTFNPGTRFWSGSMPTVQTLNMNYTCEDAFGGSDWSVYQFLFQEAPTETPSMSPTPSMSQSNSYSPPATLSQSRTPIPSYTFTASQSPIPVDSGGNGGGTSVATITIASAIFGMTLATLGFIYKVKGHKIDIWCSANVGEPFNRKIGHPISECFKNNYYRARGMERPAPTNRNVMMTRMDSSVIDFQG